MTTKARTRILTRGELSTLLVTTEYIEGVEYAFRQHAEGRSFGTAMIHGDTPNDVEFHIKAGGLQWKGKAFYALKANGSPEAQFEFGDTFFGVKIPARV